MRLTRKGSPLTKGQKALRIEVLIEELKERVKSLEEDKSMSEGAKKNNKKLMLEGIEKRKKALEYLRDPKTPDINWQELQLKFHFKSVPGSMYKDKEWFKESRRKEQRKRTKKKNQKE